MHFFSTPRAKRRELRRLADGARDRGDWLEAARLYEAYLEKRPDDAAIHIQAGHMFKEARRLDDAGRHYATALTIAPDDADLALQLGHFHKLMGRLDRSEAEYRRALTLRPGWSEAKRELANLLNWGWRSRYDDQPASELIAVDGDKPSALDSVVLSALSSDGVLAPELVGLPPEKLMHLHNESFHLRRLGRGERSHWGMIATLRGIEAVRGFWISSTPLQQVAIYLNGNAICRGTMRGPYTLKYEIERQRTKKYVFNEWIDFSRFEHGRYLLAIEAIGVDGVVHRHEQHVMVAEPLSPRDHPASDGIVDVSLGAEGRLDERINAQPSIVRDARRTLFQQTPRNILVLRTDQLGDMVASVPAMVRLRKLFPEAKIVGLLTSGNADFAGTLGVFDEVLTVDFPDDPVNRRRIMGLAEQKALKERLEPYRFDLAIDMADAGVSRPLLLLSGAPILFGFRDREFPYLTAGYEGNSHDIWNGMECVGHSTQAVSLISRLEALAQSHSITARREDLSPDRLRRFGLSSERPYVLLHAGARIEYSRWPYHDKLTKLFLRNTDLDVVLMGLEGEARASFPSELFQMERFKLIEGLLPFDDFDALISHASVFVGNDSGPKHLASFRGVKVVGLHLARNNWTEWGQEHGGVVISRRLPCAGCNIFYDAEECGKDFVCLRQINPEEVFEAAMSLLAS